MAKNDRQRASATKIDGTTKIESKPSKHKKQKQGTTTKKESIREKSQQVSKGNRKTNRQIDNRKLTFHRTLYFNNWHIKYIILFNNCIPCSISLLSIVVNNSGKNRKK